MNQDDFRQMLASRGSHNGNHSYGGKRNLTEADLAEIKKLSVKKVKKKGKKPKNVTPVDEGETEHRPIKSLYRDRAAERREGNTGDMIDAEDYKHLDAEQSKFLGGDMEHTHLVKGLDYALLAQLKREKQKLLIAKQKQVESMDTRVKKTEMAKPRNGRLTFKSRIGRLVYFHACQSTPETTTSVKSELFLPGRMYYTFDLSTTEIDSAPVSVQRCKEDCPEPDEVVGGIVDESLIEQVKKLMNKKKRDRKMRKKTTLSRHHNCDEEMKEHTGQAQNVEATAIAQVEAETAVINDDDDDDIFPDVGEYIPIDQRSEISLAELSAKESIKETGYFMNLSASITEKEEAARKKEQDAERAWKETLQKAVKQQEKFEREKEQKAKEAKMIGQADDYAEYQGVCALADSDDEDDEETARRRKAAGLNERKADHSAEEKARRKKQKQSNKLANDLEKVNKIMQNKL